MNEKMTSWRHVYLKEFQLMHFAGFEKEDYLISSNIAYGESFTGDDFSGAVKNIHSKTIDSLNILSIITRDGFFLSTVLVSGGSRTNQTASSLLEISHTVATVH
jgi:hypothetical protein